MFHRLFEHVDEEMVRCSGLHAVTYSRRDHSNGSTILIVPPDGEERAFALRPLVTAARAMAAAGHHVVRFDFSGQGMTDGDYSRTTLASRIEDLERVWQLSIDRFKQAPVLLGARFGASIAIAAAPQLAGLKRMVLVEPVLDSPAYLQGLLRVAIAAQMVVHGKVLRDRNELISSARAGELVSVNGFNLSGTFIDELLSLDLRAGASQWRGEVLALMNGAVPAAWASLPDWQFTKVATPPFWREPKIHQAATLPFVPVASEWLHRQPVSL